MAIEITVPRLGWSMEEGTFLGWLKKDGDRVRAGEPLFTLEGDKAAQEIEAVASGILRIPSDAPQLGASVLVGQVLAHLVTSDSSPVAGSPRPEASRMPEADQGSMSSAVDPAVPRPAAPTPLPRASFVKPGSESTAVRITPRARRKAAELGVDVRQLKGRGRDGRIIEADVVEAAAKAAGAAADASGVIGLS